MATSAISYSSFVFEFKKPDNRTTTGSRVEKVSTFACRSNVANALGIAAAAQSGALTKRSIASFTRTATLVGGVELTPKLGSGATITVRAYDRVNPSRSQRHGKIAIIKWVAIDAESTSKTKGHRTSRFIFPSGISIMEIGIALSMLFNKVDSAIVSTPATKGLIYGNWHTVNGTSYPFITDTATLTSLETSYGVQVATNTTTAGELEGQG